MFSSFPYPPPSQGYWSPITSTLQWCEEDYYATPYIAEIVNALTNLIFVYLAYRGISNCIQHGHDRVFVAAFSSYLLTGIGSFCFHTSLKYSMQLVDELSMVYTVCVAFYAVFSHRQPPRTATLLLIFSCFLAAFITVYYHYLQLPAFHQAAFGLITFVVIGRSIYLMEAQLRPALRESLRTPSRLATPDVDAKDSATVDAYKWERLEQGEDDKIMRTMWALVTFGLVCVALGVACWFADNLLCSEFRRLRKAVGLPWGILLEGHGWWHIFTGIAAYSNLVWAIWLRYCLDGRHHEVELYWPSMFTSVPVVLRRELRHSNPFSDDKRTD